MRVLARKQGQAAPLRRVSQIAKRAHVVWSTVSAVTAASAALYVAVARVVEVLAGAPIRGGLQTHPRSLPWLSTDRRQRPR